MWRVGLVGGGLLRSHVNAVAVINAVRCKTTDPFDRSARPVATLEPDTLARVLQNERLGSKRLRCHFLPDKITAAVNHILGNVREDIGTRVDSYLEAGVRLRNVLNSRHAPVEKEQERSLLEQYKQIIEKKYSERLSDPSLTEEAVGEIEAEIERKARTRLADKVRLWKPVQFDETTAWAYLLAKAPFDYATVATIMDEIKERDPEFQPRTLFDFGSGVGTAIWASRAVFGHMTEIFAVDTSLHMNELSRLILLDGKASHSLPAGTSFRLHLPAANDLTYDLVTCCHTLLELPTAEARLTAVDNLWRKTAPGGFLVVVEEGTNAGFQTIAEARDYLIQVRGIHKRNPDLNETFAGALFAPCPHEVGCPRYSLDTIPCNFNVKYKNWQLNGIPNEVRDIVRVDRFSYVVFRKGLKRSDEMSYPRLVAEPMLRHRHVVCRMCTAAGKLEEYVASPNKDSDDERLIYRYAKRLHCGDRMLVKLRERTEQDIGHIAAKMKKAKAQINQTES